MTTYDQLIAEWNTKQVTKFGGQCVALIAEYEAENNFPIVWGDAAAWVNNPIMLTHYNWVQNDPNDANQVPNRGDIIVWGPDLPYTNGAGHIAFFDRAIDHEKFMSFGQNSGGPSAHFQEHSWAYVAGWYVNKQAPTPTPQQPTYSITETYPEGKLVQLNKQPTNLWGMNYHFDYMKDHPVEEHTAGEVITVSNKVHHEDGYDYYRRDGQVDGFNVLDCDDYTPPPPAPPAAPLAFPGNGEIFTAITQLHGYMSGTQAGNLGDNYTTTFEPGEYFVYRYYPQRTDLVNITTDKTKAGAWINTAQNVLPPPPPEPEKEPDGFVSPRASSTPDPTPEPEPEPTPEPPKPVISPDAWKATYVPFHPGATRITEPQVWRVNISGNISDVSGQRDIEIPIYAGQDINLYGIFFKDDHKYYRVKLKSDTDFKWWFAVPQEYQGRAVVVMPPLNWIESIYHAFIKQKQGLKSIFPDKEAQYIDSIQLNPFKKKK